MAEIKVVEYYPYMHCENLTNCKMMGKLFWINIEMILQDNDKK